MRMYETEGNLETFSVKLRGTIQCRYSFILTNIQKKYCWLGYKQIFFYPNQISFSSKATEVSLADLNETLQIRRVQKNNRHVFFYIGEGSRLRAETTLPI